MVETKITKTDGITLLFFVLLISVVAIIYISLVGFNINSILLLVLIWILVSAVTLIIKKVSLDKDINSKDVSNIFLSSFLSSFFIVGSSILLVNFNLIISRAFENTVGYLWINGEYLTGIMKTAFKNNNGANYNLIVTQLFYDDEKRTQFDSYLKKMTNDSEDNPFKGVTSVYTDDYDKKDSELPINKLYEMVIKKNNISKATIISLATIAAIYTCYLPIKSPWING